MIGCRAPRTGQEQSKLWQRRRADRSRATPKSAQHAPEALRPDNGVQESEDENLPAVVLNRVQIYREGVCEWASRYSHRIPEPYAIPSTAFAHDVFNALTYFASIYGTVGYVGRVAAFVRIDDAEKAYLSVARHSPCSSIRYRPFATRCSSFGKPSATATAGHMPRDNTVTTNALSTTSRSSIVPDGICISAAVGKGGQGVRKVEGLVVRLDRGSSNLPGRIGRPRKHGVFCCLGTTCRLWQWERGKSIVFGKLIGATPGSRSDEAPQFSA